MVDVPVKLVSAFVDDKRGGNPAGVVLDANSLTAAQKQAVAAQVGKSETAFISDSNVADIKLEFFTPTRQIAHCGHATIATFNYLRDIGRLSPGPSSKETIDGNRDIMITDDMVFMEQLAPRYTDIPEQTQAVLDSLNLTADALLDEHQPTIVNTGNSFLVVPLHNEDAVLSAQPDAAAVEAISEQFDLIGYYVFSPQTRTVNRDAGARMFAPRYGIPEESATGMAAGPLACYLHDRLGRDSDQLVIEQGQLMSPPSPSIITVKLQRDGGRIQSLMAGGRGIAQDSLTITI